MTDTTFDAMPDLAPTEVDNAARLHLDIVRQNRVIHGIAGLCRIETSAECDGHIRSLIALIVCDYRRDSERQANEDRGLEPRRCHAFGVHLNLLGGRLSTWMLVVLHRRSRVGERTRRCQPREHTLMRAI